MLDFFAAIVKESVNVFLLNVDNPNSGNFFLFSILIVPLTSLL